MQRNATVSMSAYTAARDYWPELFQGVPEQQQAQVLQVCTRVLAGGSGLTGLTACCTSLYEDDPFLFVHSYVCIHYWLRTCCILSAAPHPRQPAS